jgi:hypothetical protein
MCSLAALCGDFGKKSCEIEQFLCFKFQNNISEIRYIFVVSLAEALNLELIFLLYMFIRLVWCQFLCPPSNLRNLKFNLQLEKRKLYIF